jgi:hypothetical protein
MALPPITFDWQLNIGHVLVAISMLTAGAAAYVDLRRDISDLVRAQAVDEARLEALTVRMNAQDVANATLGARFAVVEELMREVRNDLREMRGRPPASAQQQPRRP